jgi:hypothetical protein
LRATPDAVHLNRGGSLDNHAGRPYSLDDDDRDATQLAICARELMPSLFRMCRMWLSTVLSEINKRCAICFSRCFGDQPGYRCLSRATALQTMVAHRFRDTSSSS